MLKTCSVHAMVRNSMLAARYWPGHILGMTVVSKYSTECSVVTLTFFQNRISVLVREHPDRVSRQL